MGVVVSALVYTQKDVAGNPRTEAWLTLEFSGVYATDGQFFDLSPYFRRIEHAAVFPMSGGEARAPISGAATVHVASGSKLQMTPVVADYTAPVSARFLIGAQSMLSGTGHFIDVLSGLAASVSGVRFGARVIGY